MFSQTHSIKNLFSEYSEYSSIRQGKCPKGIKGQRSLDVYVESNENKKNIRETQDDSLECFSSKNNKETLDEGEVGEKTPLKQNDEKDTCATKVPAARSVSLIEPGQVIHTLINPSVYFFLQLIQYLI